MEDGNSEASRLNNSVVIGLPATGDGNSAVEMKRKRGRPPRSQPKEPAPKKQSKEEEDVCFICFDGGSLVLCDRRSCPKAYHPACIKRDESFFQVKARWTCGWHICNICLKAAHYMCYTCTYSLCKGCTSDADYLRVRGDKGLCGTCMRTIMLIEEKEEGDNEMVHVDFDDKSSWEYLFKEYWLDLKEKLSLNFAELSHAKNLQKESRTMICKGQVPCFQEGTNNIKIATVDSSVVPQTNLSDYAAIDMHNINMIYLRRNLMENLLEDKMFHDKVVGSVVRIKILGGEQKHEMYRLVKVVGTIKVFVPYKVGVKTTTVMLEVLNLDKKEVVSIDTISNQDFSEDECRHLKQSIECGLLKRFIVGEIQEKALALQSVKLNDRLEAETRRLNHLHDRESENGHKKEECVEPQEQQHRLCEIPDVHLDPNMDPGYKSEKAERLDSQKQVHCNKPRYSGRREGKPISPRKKADLGHTGRRACIFATPSGRRNMSATSSPTKEESGVEIQQRLSVGRDAYTLRSLNNQVVGTSTTFSTPAFSVGNTSDACSSETKLWHYIDPNGKIQGPFCMVQLQEWSTTGYFPPDLRIWAGDSQENSILLTDALKGFHKVAPLPNYISSQLQDVGVISDSELDMSDLGFSHLVQSSGDTWKNSPTEVSSYTLHLNSEPSPNFLSVAAQLQGKLDATDVGSPLKHAGETSGNKESVSCAHIKDLGFPDRPKTGIGYPKELAEKTQQPVSSSSPYHDSGPNWSSTSSITVRGQQLGEKSEDWGDNSPTSVKRCVNGWDSSLSSLSMKPADGLCGHVAPATSTSDEIAQYFETHFASYQSTCQLSSEPIELTTLPDETILDLWAEVDAMESQQVLASPTVTNRGGIQNHAAANK